MTFLMLNDPQSRRTPAKIPYIGDNDILPPRSFKCHPDLMKEMNPTLIHIYLKIASETLQRLLFDHDFSHGIGVDELQRDAHTHDMPEVLALVFKNGHAVAAMAMEKEWNAIWSGVQSDVSRASQVIEKVARDLDKFFYNWICGDFNEAKLYWMAHRYIRRQWNYVQLMVRAELDRFLGIPACLDLPPVLTEWWEPSDPFCALKLQATMGLVRPLSRALLQRDFTGPPQCYFDERERMEIIEYDLQTCTVAFLNAAVGIGPRSYKVLAASSQAAVLTLIGHTTASLLPMLWNDFFRRLTTRKWDAASVKTNQLPGWLRGPILITSVDGSIVTDAQLTPISNPNFTDLLHDVRRAAMIMVNICRATFRLDCRLPQTAIPIPCIVGLEHTFVGCRTPCSCEVRASVYVTNETAYLHAPVTFHSSSLVEECDTRCQGVLELPLSPPPKGQSKCFTLGGAPWEAYFMPLEPKSLTETPAEGNEEEDDELVLAVEQEWICQKLKDMFQVTHEVKFLTLRIEGETVAELYCAIHTTQFFFNYHHDSLLSFRVMPTKTLST